MSLNHPTLKNQYFVVCRKSGGVMKYWRRTLVRHGWTKWQTLAYRFEFEDEATAEARNHLDARAVRFTDGA